MTEEPKRNPEILRLEQALAAAQQDNAMVGVVLAGVMLDGMQTRLLQARQGDSNAREFVKMARALFKAYLEDESRIVTLPKA